MHDEPEITLENYELLAKRYRAMMFKHIRDVYRMHSKAADLSDLEQEAHIALFNAIKNFDKTKGVYFPVYLSKSVMNSLLNFCRNYLPHYYAKDPDRPGRFKRIKVYVGSTDEQREEYGDVL